MEDEDYEEEVVDRAEGADDDTDDYLNEILTESQENEEETDEFVKNKEGVTGDEWKDDEKERLLKDIKAENKRNAERRIREKREREQQEEDDEETEFEELDVDAEELRTVSERNQWLEQRLNVAAPVMDYLVQNQIGQNELQLAVDFVNNWRTDKIGTVKKLLTSLESSGIDIGTIITHDDSQLRVMNEVNQRMQPIMQQRAAEQRYVESKKVLDNFLDNNPDAWEHLEEITEVMRKSGIPDPYRAYLNLRRVYSQNNQPWFAEEEIMPKEEPIPEVSSPSVNYAERVPERYNDIGDVVSSEARKFFRR